MRSCAMRRRFHVASIVLLSVLGLAIPIAFAQTRPGGTTATSPAASQAGLRERLAERIAELSKRIEERLELQRLAGRANDELARQEEAARGGKSLDVINPSFRNDQYQLRQMEIQRDLMLDHYGSENPRYKAVTTQLAKMREAYQRNLAAAQAKAAAAIDSARTEAAAAQAKLNDAVKREEAAKRELIDSAAGAANAR
jgi:hypothetical protein